MKASNRQKKLLKFFNVEFAPGISVGGAGWEIAAIMESGENKELWRKYQYLTGDFDCDSDELKPFDKAALGAVEVPDEWNAEAAKNQYFSELVANQFAGESPFDNPQPIIEFQDKRFLFTGKFEFGSRNACQAMVSERGGLASDAKKFTLDIDYLVVGSDGSKCWKRGSYGNKIEAAIFARRQFGSPAIISEEHWVASLGAGN